MIGTSHIGSCLRSEQLKMIVNSATKVVQRITKDTDIKTIVFSGMSGAGVAFPVSYNTGLELICVRKDKDDTHSEFKVEAGIHDLSPRPFIIIDDLIETGKTVNRILSALRNERWFKPFCKGIVLYKDYLWSATYKEKYRGIPLHRVNW